MSRRIAIVSGVRTPFAKAYTDLADLDAFDLALIASQELLQRTDMPSDELDEVIWGSVLPTMSRLNIGREVPIALGLDHVPGYTLGQQCASGIQSITSAAEHIGGGDADTVLAGGSESMSGTPVTYPRSLIHSLRKLSTSKTMKDKLKSAMSIKLKHFFPKAPAIEEPSTGLSMGQHAERMAQINGISRKDQDEYALESHRKATLARDEGRVNDDLVPVSVPPKHDQLFVEDNLIRRDTSMSRLSKLRPVFDRKHGTLTAGNSSALTDGASAVMLMAEDRAQDLGLEPWGYLRAYDYVAIPPNPQLLLGPAYSIPRVLGKAELSLGDIQLVELHEAFSAQVLSVLQKLESDDFARDELGQSEAVGEIDRDILNVNGGSLAFGHPFAATGGRIVINLLQELSRRDMELGLLSICTANAMGVSMILERR